MTPEVEWEYSLYLAMFPLYFSQLIESLRFHKWSVQYRSLLQQQHKECISLYIYGSQDMYSLEKRFDFTSKLLYLSKNLIKGKKLCAGISPAAAKACSVQVLCNFATGYPAVR